MELIKDIKLVKRPDKVLVYSSKEGILFETNEIGEFIIQKLKEGLKKEEILDGLINETKAKKEIVNKDLNDFLDRLVKEGFLK